MNSMTIGKKLFLSFGAALVLTLTVGIVTFTSIGSLETTIDKLVKVNARKLFLAGEINTVMSDYIAEERGVIARGMTKKDRATVDKYQQDFRDSTTRIKKRMDEFATLIESAEARRMIPQMQSNVEKLVGYQDELYRQTIAENMDAAIQVARDKFTPLALETNAMAERMVALQQELTASTAKAAGESVSQSRWLTALMIMLSIAVGLGVVFIVRQINTSLRQTVAELHNGATQTASAASQVSSSSQSLAQGASEQAASLEETSASTEEISSMAHKNSDNSRVAADLVMQAHQKFGETNQSLEQMVAAMGEISESSDKISKIIRTIDEIAFQTNILALNAAVEAARAGEAGMGFAVVADEVRSLAQRCAQAAKDTAELIEDSIAKSNGGKTKVNQVAGAVLEIAELAGRVKTLVDEVNLGSQEQARGIEQIGKAISQMEQVTQKTAAGAEESASAAEELTAQSETLRDIVNRLSAMVDGVDATSSRSNGANPSTRAKRVATTATPPRRRDSTAGLLALRSAVAKKHSASLEPVGAGARTNTSAIPMDEDFKEF